MKFFIDECIEDYKTFLQEIRNLNQSEDEENQIDNKIRRHQLEESFAMSFFIHMNNALFAGEYLDKIYDTKIALFDDCLAQDDSAFSLQIKKAIDHLKTLKTLVNNKINLIGEDLLFSAIKSHNTLDVDKSGFLLKFTNISIRLAMADHFLIYQSTDDVATLLFLLDALGQEINIANEELKSIYQKLYSKCSLLLKKVCYIMDDSHKYALDFKIYDIKEKQNIDTYNEEFDSLFEGLYQKRNISNTARNYQNKFRSNEFSTKGFIVLSHYYRTETKDCSQIANLIWRFNKFYVTRKKKNSLSDFDRYALECVRLYLHNSQFSLNIDQPKYSIEQLKMDLEKIRRIQVDTQIWNYHPYYKSLDFLSRLIKNNELIQNEQYCTQIDDIISLHELLLSSYKKCIDWCNHRTFYPFQLEHADCISSGNMFCASTFAIPLNIKDLNAFYRKCEGDHQVLIMQGNYISNRRELNEIQQKITSYRKETFEYIGIFIAIITFLFGSLQIFGAELDWHQSISSIVSLGSVLCIFGAILSASFNEKWPLWGKFTFYALIILVSILFIIFSPLILSMQTP